MDRVDQLEVSVRELATVVAELARDRVVGDRMARIVARHSADDDDPPATPDPTR